MFGVLADLFMNERNIEAAADRQHDQQQFNSAEALANREWQERMSNTAVRRNKADLEAAGFNPLLAVHPGGGATTPSGGAASSSIASPHSGPNISAAMATASQVEVNEALARKIDAEEEEIRARTPTHGENIERTRAETEEIRARIPTHAAQVERLNQEVAESAVRIEKIWEDVKVSSATASHLNQQVINLNAALPLIKAQITHLKALAAKESAETDEIKQRIRADLPGMERILGNLERIEREMKQPENANRERAADSFIGQMGAYLEHFKHALPGAFIFNRRSNTNIDNSRTNKQFGDRTYNRGGKK